MNFINTTELAIHRTKLAEERTEMAFIRTAAIFCGIYALIKKNLKKSIFIKIILNVLLSSIGILLLYRLSKISNITKKQYVISLGLAVVFCIFVLLIIL